MSYQSQDYTIHLEDHSEPRADCEYCDRLMWGEDNWSKEDLEKYAETMNRESGVPKPRPNAS